MNVGKLDHYVTVVGYDAGALDAAGAPLQRDGYWIIRNSYGSKWGAEVRGPAACEPAAQPHPVA